MGWRVVEDERWRLELAGFPDEGNGLLEGDSGFAASLRVSGGCLCSYWFLMSLSEVARLSEIEMEEMKRD